MEIAQAHELLDKAKATLSESVTPHWERLLHAMQRRLDHEDRMKIKTGQTKPCIHAEKQDDLFMPHRPCKGRKVLCSNPDNPVDVWYESGCRPEKCKFYEATAQEPER